MNIVKMNPKFTAIIILLLISFTGKAQVMLNEAVLKYTETRSRVSDEGNAVKRTIPHTIAFSANKLKNTSNPKEHIFLTELSDKTQKTTVSYLTNGEKYYTTDEKYAPKFFSLGLYEGKTYTLQLSDDTANIGKYKCNKAVYDVEIKDSHEEIEVWYCKDMQLNTGGFPYFFNELKGVPVKFRFTERSKFVFAGAAKIVCEYMLDTIYSPRTEDITAIENIENYVKISDEEKMPKLMEIMNGTTVRSAPKGDPITKKIAVSDGTTFSVTRYNPFKTGEKIKNFSASNMEGVSRSLENYKGNVIVMNFWFTKCMPCIKEMPLLNKTAAAFAGKKVSFLAITYNTAEEAKTFLKSNEFNFENLVNAQQMIDLYGVSSYPATIVVDKEGIIRFIQPEAFKTEDELVKEINKLL